jgi:hypothetical protein
MSNYSKDRMRLVSQGITGGKIWYLSDTGLFSTPSDSATFITNAGDMGVDSGDLLLIQAKGSAGAGTNNLQVYASAFTVPQDTGATQGTIGPHTLIGDTG